MFKILILPSIGVVLILLLRSKKQEETLPVFRYEEETSITGDSTNYIEQRWEERKFWTKEDRGFDTKNSSSSDF